MDYNITLDFTASFCHLLASPELTESEDGLRSRLRDLFISRTTLLQAPTHPHFPLSSPAPSNKQSVRDATKETSTFFPSSVWPSSDIAVDFFGPIFGAAIKCREAKYRVKLVVTEAELRAWPRPQNGGACLASISRIPARTARKVLICAGDNDQGTR